MIFIKFFDSSIFPHSSLIGVCEGKANSFGAVSSPGRIVLFSNVWASIHVGPLRFGFSANSWLVLLCDDRLLDSESDDSSLLTRCSFALTGVDTPLRLFHGLIWITM